MRRTASRFAVALPALVLSLACGNVGAGVDAGAVSCDEPPAVSCSELPATCGPAGTSRCCGAELVPSGTFFRSYDVGTDAMYPTMDSPATVSDFRLDTYEVTVGRFRQFVTAGMGTQQCPPPAGAGARSLNGTVNQGGWDSTWNANLTASSAALVAAVKCDAPYHSWTDTPGANEALPMNCISWFEAFAFCAWDGGFLPTEAEWNYAAAGGDEQRAYPWSNPASDLTIDCSHANYLNSGVYCVNGGVNRVGSESPTGDGKWGQADLAGNVGEWTLDWFASPYGNPCNDCADLTPDQTPAWGRVFRGGTAGASALGLRGAFRLYWYRPDGRLAALGVRCGRRSTM